MRTYTVHLALAHAGSAQLVIGAGLTIKAATMQADQSIHPLEQRVTAKVLSASQPRQVFAVMAREDEAIFFDRIELTEPALEPHESVKVLKL